MKPPVSTDPDGTFRVENLMPGNYFLAAVTDMEPDDLTSLPFLEELAAKSLAVTLGDGEKKMQTSWRQSAAATNPAQRTISTSRTQAFTSPTANDIGTPNANQRSGAPVPVMKSTLDTRPGTVADCCAMMRTAR